MITGRSHSEEEKRILEQLAKGSELAFTQLFDRYRPRIYSVALKMLRSTTLAEEVVQEVFIKVWNRREELPQIQRFEGYLFTMARNHIFDGFKQLALEVEAKKSFLNRVEPVNNTDYPVIERQYGELLQETLKLLTPQQKQVYHLARVKGMSHKAIAQRMRISRLTVKTHMAKALKFIRQRLEHHVELHILLLLLTIDL